MKYGGGPVVTGGASAISNLSRNRIKSWNCLIFSNNYCRESKTILTLRLPLVSRTAPVCGCCTTGSEGYLKHSDDQGWGERRRDIT